MKLKSTKMSQLTQNQPFSTGKFDDKCIDTLKFVLSNKWLRICFLIKTLISKTTRASKNIWQTYLLWNEISRRTWCSVFITDFIRIQILNHLVDNTLIEHFVYILRRELKIILKFFSRLSKRMGSHGINWAMAYT